MTPKLVYRCRARWCPSRSLLGHLLQLRAKNWKQAETLYLIAISSIITVLIVMQFLVWSLWHEAITNVPAVAMWYWTCQLGSAVLVFAGGLAGYCPGVKMELTESCLSVSQGQRSAEISLDTSTRCRIVSALQYYREWDSRADRYMTRIPDDVLLVFTDQKVLAIGISSAAHAELLNAMEQSDSAKEKMPNGV